MLKRARSLIVLVIIVLTLFPSPPKKWMVEAQESPGSISFTPSAIPEIGFEYNAAEYQFELTWKSYYLNIKPFAIYNGEYRELKTIIPWLKNNYPNVDYRTAADKFKNYHRWGFWLEKLPQNVADNLDYLGFDVSDTNIPLSVVEVETIEDGPFPFKRIHIGGRFSIDFYDLYERGFEVDINKTTILIGNVKGKTDLDLDPITYAAPAITVTGYTKAVPCTFWDIWNASNVNGWDVVHNHQNNNTQYQFDTRLVFGDGANTTWFNDTRKQVTFIDGIITGTWQDMILVKNNATLTLGELVNSNTKETQNGCDIYINETTWEPTKILRENSGKIYLYSSVIRSTGGRRVYVTTQGRVWNTLFADNVGCYTDTDADLYNVIIMNTEFAILNTHVSTTTMDNIFVLDAIAVIYGQNGPHTISNIEMIGETRTFMGWNFINEAYLIDIGSDLWEMHFTGVSTGETYRQNTFNLELVDRNGESLLGADVSLTWEGQGGGTAYTGTTPANGSIPEQTITKGFYNQTGDDTIYPYEPYNLTVTATGYESTSVIFNISEPIDWTIALVEESIDVEVTIGSELLVFSAIAGAFMFVAWFGDETKGLVAATLSFFVWFATGLWWLWEKAPAGTMDFFYIFEMLALVSLMLAIYKAGTIYKANSKTGIDSI